MGPKPQQNSTRSTRKTNAEGDEGDQSRNNPANGAGEQEKVDSGPSGSSQKNLSQDEKLTRYIQNIVTASVGLSMAEELQRRQAEDEVDRANLRKQIVSDLREEMRAFRNSVSVEVQPVTDNNTLNADRFLNEIRFQNDEDPTQNQNLNVNQIEIPNQNLGQNQNQEPNEIDNRDQNRPPRQAHESSREELDFQPSENFQNFMNRLEGLNLNPSSSNHVSNPSNRVSNPTQRIPRVDFKKWGLTFDNKKMSIEDFLFRLNFLRMSYEVTWDEIFLYFHIFVAGEVETWLWMYLKSNPGATWRHLELSLIEQYKRLETDTEISRQMFDRRQGQTETFDSFYLDIMQLNSRLQIPKRSHEIIDLIKQNVKRRTGELLITFTTKSLPEMVYVCRTIEKRLGQYESLKTRTFPVTNSNTRPKVNELDLQDEESQNFDAVEAISQQKNLSTMTCWNCRAKGHKYKLCDIPQRNLFCFNCGLENYTSTKCPNCAENRNRGNRTGEFCPARVNPEQKQA